MVGELLNELALFAGAGGGILGGKLLGWRTVCAVEIDPYCRSILLSRQRDGILPRFPIWDDVCTFDGKPWRGRVDVISGGFPCQDISAAGKKTGISGKRSGLWREYARIIGEVKPRFAFIENSPLLRGHGLVRVLKDLAVLGYDAEWMVLSAREVGAPHLRKRMWVVAHSVGVQLREQPRGCCWESRQDKGIAGVNGQEQHVAYSECHGLQGTIDSVAGERAPEVRRRFTDSSWWSIEPDVGRVANGVASRMDRLRAIGNGQVPAVAATAWTILTSVDKKAKLEGR